jgi:hypothetical protein
MPGATATLSSGYTNKLTADALRCDKQRVLARLQNGAVRPCPLRPLPGGGVDASILELDAQRGCQNQSNQSSAQSIQAQFEYPRAGIPESVRIQRVQQNVITASVNPLDPLTRFSMYDRNILPLVCPPPVINSTQPRAPMRNCVPRFYSPSLS